MKSASKGDQSHSHATVEIPEDVFLFIGQSNMAGRAEIVPEDTQGLANALLWTGTAWEPAKPPFNRYFEHRKRDKPQGVNPALAFVRGISSGDGGHSKVGIVCCAVGGSALDEWAPGSPYYKAALQMASAHRARLRAILWHQGESDSSPDAVREYPRKLAQLVASLRQDLGGVAHVPFVFSQVGRWNPDYAAFNAMIVQVKDIDNSGCVTTEGLTGLDYAHFDRDSQLVLGQRFLEQYQQLTATK